MQIYSMEKAVCKIKEEGFYYMFSWRIPTFFSCKIQQVIVSLFLRFCYSTAVE